jgi:cytoskeletal protein RodZ
MAEIANLGSDVKFWDHVRRSRQSRKRANRHLAGILISVIIVLILLFVILAYLRRRRRAKEVTTTLPPEESATRNMSTTQASHSIVEILRPFKVHSANRV